MAAEDLLDVVDERDAVQATLPREEVHRRKLLHRCVHVLVFDPRGRLWLQKRSLALRLYPGRWTSTASGHVDAGERYLDSARRELEEEMGLRAEPRQLATFRFQDDEENELSALCEARSADTPTPNPDEVLGVMAVMPDELDALLQRLPGSFSPSFRAAWQEYQRLTRVGKAGPGASGARDTSGSAHA
jgi:isopentenyldiphosphate isomerase